MSRIGVLAFLTALSCVAAPSAQAPGRTAVAIEADKNDGPATLLATALVGELRRSETYRLADTSPDAAIVVHVVGLVIPDCRSSNAVAVSYVSMPVGKHLGTAVLLTTRSRAAASARDVLAKLLQMAGTIEQK